MANLPCAALLAAALLFSAPARAIDSASFEAGHGKSTDLWRVGVQWNWQKTWQDAGDWHIGGYWDAQFGRWSGSDRHTITDFGLTPVFRLEQNSRSAISPYAEAAIGFHLIQPVRQNDERDFSSSFQFGDHVGLGARFGERHRYDLSLRLQHLSNGGIKEPNDGINFTQLRFQLHF
jgi:hypothetical protein